MTFLVVQTTFSMWRLEGPLTLPVIEPGSDAEEVWESLVGNVKNPDLSSICPGARQFNYKTRNRVSIKKLAKKKVVATQATATSDTDLPTEAEIKNWCSPPSKGGLTTKALREKVVEHLGEDMLEHLKTRKEIREELLGLIADGE